MFENFKNHVINLFYLYLPKLARLHIMFLLWIFKFIFELLLNFLHFYQ